MTSTNGNVTNQKFDPMEAMQAWQTTAARMSRAGEQIMRGFMSAAQLQTELATEILHHQLATLQYAASGEKPEAVWKAQIEHSVEEMAHLLIAMQKMSTEIQSGLLTATRTLLEPPTL
jgi:hypothetical protein